MTKPQTRSTSQSGFALALGILALTLTPHNADAKKKSKKSTPWSLARQVAKGPPAAIGGYSAGCVSGAVTLPHSGTGYQVMRPSRHRYYGHPALVDFIKGFATSVQKNKLGPMLIGDLGHAKGGPSASGHASHQSGLDVDIWFWHPAIANKRKLSKRERERIGAKRIVDPKKQVLTKAWSGDVGAILAIAAADPRVSKIFVNPVIKREVCDSGKLSTEVLRKIRPWYGHADHMHVRLHCPEKSPLCEAQAALPEGDSCAGLAWWFDEEAQKARREKRKSYQSKVGASPTLPDACYKLIE